MSYKIEDGIPLPKNKQTRNTGLSECLLSMAITQSVFVEDWKRTSMQAFVSKLGSHHGKKFICRIEGNGLRVWRSV